MSVSAPTSTSERSVVVTGVSSGIGHATAKLLLGKGMRVFGSVRTGEDAARLSREFGGRFTPLVFDVRDEMEVASEAARVRAALDGRRLTALVNNAGLAIPGPMLIQPLAEIREQIEADLLGPIIVTRAFAPLLGTDPVLSGDPGRIVMMSTIGGKIGQPFMSGYVAAKHGLEGLSETLRREARLFGIDVVIVGPALVDTPIWDKAEPYAGRYAGTPYAEPFDKGVTTMVKAGHDHALAVEKVAEIVWTAISARRPALRYAPAQHPLVEQGLSRVLPPRWLDAIFGRFLGMRPKA